VTRQRPLGDSEKQVLAALSRCEGSWSVTSRPLWDSRYWTLQLLYSLTRKGCVCEKVAGTFEITDAGQRTVEDLGLLPSSVWVPRQHRQ
jgi:hypothetical protein